MNILQPKLHRSCYGVGMLHRENKSKLTKWLTQSYILAGPIVWALDWGSKDDQINQIVQLLSRLYNNPNLSQNCTIHNLESARRFAVLTSDFCLHARHTSYVMGRSLASFAWFQVSVPPWNFTQHWVVIPDWRFQTTYWSDLQGSSETAWPLKIGTIGFPETSVWNYDSTLHKIPEEHRSCTSLHESLLRTLPLLYRQVVAGR